MCRILRLSEKNVMFSSCTKMLLKSTSEITYESPSAVILNCVTSGAGQKKVASIIDKAGLPLQIDSSGDNETKVTCVSYKVTPS